MTTLEMRAVVDYKVKCQNAECTGFSLKWCINIRTTNGKHVWFLNLCKMSLAAKSTI